MARDTSDPTGREQRTVAIQAAASTQLAGPNERRRGILISAPPTNRVTLSFAGAAVLDQGITIYPAGNPLYLTTDVFG